MLTLMLTLMPADGACSYPPFYDEDPMKTYSKIMAGKINYPAHFSKDAINLISRLLEHKPTKRLGVVKGGADLIKSHPFFKGFDWEAMYRRKLEPPIKQPVANPEDTSNFDDYPDVCICRCNTQHTHSTLHAPSVVVPVP
jgi:protein kinase A